MAKSRTGCTRTDRGSKRDILFASDAELQEFRRRVQAYGAEIPSGQINPAYSALIGAIEELGPILPNDRIGPSLRKRNLTQIDQFTDEENYVVDVELWEIGSQAERGARVNELSALIQTRGGEVVDPYVRRRPLTLFRLKGLGASVRFVLELDDVAAVDHPPKPEALVADLIDIAIDDLPETPPPSADAPQIGVLDSGLTSAHPLLSPAVGTALARCPRNSVLMMCSGTARVLLGSHSMVM